MNKYVFPSGIEAGLTANQRASLDEIVAREGLSNRITVYPLVAGSGVVLLNLYNMWLGIELDGSVHS